MAPGERKEHRAPAALAEARRHRQGRRTRRGFGQPSLGIRSSQSRLHGEKVPRRWKAPDFSNSDVQRATLAIHSLGLVGVFFLFFVIFFFFFFLLFLSRRLLRRRRRCRSPRRPWAKEPQVRARARPPGSGVPQPGRVLRSPAPGATPALLRGGRADPAGGEEPGGDAPSRDGPLARGLPLL